jgi:cobalt-zinc-cadmium efflux system outer membrane protein
MLLALPVVALRADESSPAISPPVPPALRFAKIPAEPVPLPPIDGEASENFLTLAEAEATALSNHPAMREVEGLVRAARGEWVQAGLRPNPEIGYEGQEIGIDKTSGMQGGFISQEFVTAGKLGLSRAVARREIAAAEQRLERTRLQLVTTVRMYYYESLVAERSLAFAHQLEQVGSHALRASELRLQALEGTRAALLQSQVEFDSAVLLVDQATNRRDAARRRLASVTGVDGDVAPALDDTLGDPLPTLDWETAHRRLLEESPELAELRADVERARWAVQRASAGRVPNISIMGGAQFDDPSNDTIANVQVSLPLPLFDRNQGNIARAFGELTAAQAALDNRELALTQSLAAAIRDYHTASRRVAKYTESILPAAKQSFELVSQAYEQGELEYLEILATQRTYTEKNLSYLEDLETAWKQWAEIDGLLVGPLPESDG